VATVPRAGPGGASSPPAARPCWSWRICARTTYAELACGFGVSTSTVYRYIREGIELLAEKAPTLEQAIKVAKRKAFVILDGTLLRIDRVGMASGYDRAFYSGKHKAHGLNVQVMGAAREHGIIDALTEHEIPAAADTAYQGAGPTVAVPQRRRRKDPETGRYRPISRFQKDVNEAHARRRDPGDRANAEPKNWRVLRKLRSSPNTADELTAAAQTLMIASS
jgi:hypothetical protein